ncbi:MAG: hypothetical protein ACI4NJ_09705 [Cellvibrio sp.]
MALNPDKYNLTKAIEHIWKDESILTKDEKNLIKHASGKTSYPNTESDMDKLQVIISACKQLTLVDSNNCNWLSADGKRIPKAAEKFLYHTAKYLFENNESLPKNFIKSLAEYIRTTKSHIATLNYDGLLYRPLIRENILQGYSGSLIDGITNSGFRVENLRRERPLGYYLHLHGSPLFYSEIEEEPNKERKESKVRKRNAHQSLPSWNEYRECHFVLTHVNHKPSVIAGSQILSSYWEHIEIAFDEAHRIILFGYSGDDIHLNQKIKNHLTENSEKKIVVIEWQGYTSRSPKDREIFWGKKLGSRNIKSIQMRNITEFLDWNSIDNIESSTEFKEDNYLEQQTEYTQDTPHQLHERLTFNDYDW